MTKTLNSPLTIHCSNHSKELLLYLAGETVCVAESALSYFLSSLIFQMVEIAGLLMGRLCFDSKQTSSAFSGYGELTGNV